MTSSFTVHDVQKTGREIVAVIRPVDVHGALAALRDVPRAHPLAGGTDLLLDLQRGGSGDAVTLVDLTAIDGFRDIVDAGDHWILNGGVRHNQIVQHDGLRSTALPLVQACLEIGSPQLRNRATLAGNLVTASPANDSISALLSLDASIEICSLGAAGVESRTVPVSQFFTGFRSTVLASGELITAIRVPKLATNERGIWVKLGLRRAQAISVVHAGIVVGINPDDGSVTHARLAMGSVAPTVVVIEEFTNALVGSILDADTIAAAATATVEAVSPITDGRATAAYRVDGIGVLIERSLHAISDDKQASMWPISPPTLSSTSQLLASAPAPSERVDAQSPISVVINGTTFTASAATMTLLDWVRDEAGLTGMKEGCAEGECGACTMLLDGAAVMSCLITAAQADGRQLTTVEGLATGFGPHPIQDAFIDDFAVQCGFCIPGFLMSGARLLEEIAEPSKEQIQLALSGNLCRCTGYYPITQAIKDSAVTIRGSHV